MKNIDDLIESAEDLREKGLETGEIADELNISKETANWLLTHTGEADEVSPPSDIHLDWSSIGRSSYRLRSIANAMGDLLLENLDDEPEVVIGIAKAGVPLATYVSDIYGLELAEYTPRKQKWSDDDYEDLKGSFSRNFAEVDGKNCVIVDDVITTGRTMTETIRVIDERGGQPVGAAVLANKSEQTSIDGVVINSLVHIVSVE